MATKVIETIGVTRIEHRDHLEGARKYIVMHLYDLYDDVIWNFHSSHMDLESARKSARDHDSKLHTICGNRGTLLRRYAEQEVSRERLSKSMTARAANLR
jgi:hypothetical protein